MKVPPKRKGNSGIDFLVAGDIQPSMKVPPKRKGNSSSPAHHILAGSLNESPSEKEGKFMRESRSRRYRRSLNESPSEKEGKCH